MGWRSGHLNTVRDSFVPYFVKDKSMRTEELLGEFVEILDGLQFKAGSFLKWQVSGCLLWILHHTSIVDMKVNKEQPYVILDEVSII